MVKSSFWTAWPCLMTIWISRQVAPQRSEIGCCVSNACISLIGSCYSFCCAYKDNGTVLLNGGFPTLDFMTAISSWLSHVECILACLLILSVCCLILSCYYNHHTITHRHNHHHHRHRNHHHHHHHHHFLLLHLALPFLILCFISYCVMSWSGYWKGVFWNMKYEALPN